MGDVQGMFVFSCGAIRRLVMAGTPYGAVLAYHEAVKPPEGLWGDITWEALPPDRVIEISNARRTVTQWCRVFKDNFVLDPEEFKLETA